MASPLGSTTAGLAVEGRFAREVAFEGRRVFVFVVASFVLAWLAALPLWLNPAGLATPIAGLVLPLMMFTPALAAVLARLIPPRQPLGTGLGLGVQGWWLYWLFAWLVIPLLCFAAPFVGAAFGVFEVDLREFSGFRETLRAAGPQAEQVLDKIPLGTLVALQFAQALVIAPLINSLFTFGEEYGWRGFLLPALLPLGQWKALLLSGILWGLWHAPVILLGYNYPDHPVLGVLLMTVFCIVFGTLLGWLRLASGSLWPAVLGHSALNGAAGVTAVIGKAGVPYDSAHAGIVGWTGWILPVAVLLLLVALRRLPTRAAAAA